MVLDQTHSCSDYDEHLFPYLLACVLILLSETVSVPPPLGCTATQGFIVMGIFVVSSITEFLFCSVSLLFLPMQGLGSIILVSTILRFNTQCAVVLHVYLAALYGLGLASLTI